MCQEMPSLWWAGLRLCQSAQLTSSVGFAWPPGHLGAMQSSGPPQVFGSKGYTFTRL